MADAFDMLDRFVRYAVKEGQRNGSIAMYDAANPGAAQAMDSMAQRAEMRQMARRAARAEEARQAQRQSQRQASSDDGIGLGGAALAGGALLALGALAYNAFSSDSSGDTTAAQSSNSSDESVNKPATRASRLP